MTSERVSDAVDKFEAALNQAPDMSPYDGRRVLMLEGVKLLQSLRSQQGK